MKSISLVAILLLATNSYSQLDLYKFSGAYVRAGNESISKNITADDILRLDGATTHLFQEIYFSSDKEYSSSNWSVFPHSSRQVGAEFKLGVSRRVDDILYLSPWKFKYRYFTDWDNGNNQPKFASEGGTVHGEQAIKLDRNIILSKSGNSSFTEWIIIRIDDISPETVKDNSNQSMEPMLKTPAE